MIEFLQLLVYIMTAISVIMVPILAYIHYKQVKKLKSFKKKKGFADDDFLILFFLIFMMTIGTCAISLSDAGVLP